MPFSEVMVNVGLCHLVCFEAAGHVSADAPCSSDTGDTPGELLHRRCLILPIVLNFCGGPSYVHFETSLKVVLGYSQTENRWTTTSGLGVLRVETIASWF